MKLIVGLGNPGILYNKTRHNVGFMVLDEYLNSIGSKTDKKKFEGIYTEVNIKNEKTIFLKPQKYMNLSGEVIKKYVDYFKIDVKDILIIYDDLDIELGKIKIKYKGSSGGHNGIKNIELNLNTNEYKRIRIGIKSSFVNKTDFVLGKFKKEEQEKLNFSIKLAQEAIDDFYVLSFENLMNKYN